jgi:arylsulfatase A-like enzyme
MKPLFLYVPFNAPHTPLQLPPDPAPYPAIQDEDRRTFAAMTTRMDDAVGWILDALDAEGMTRDTIVLFFSDNGGPTQNGASNGPFRGGKRSCFEGGIRVAAAMRWPERIAAGSRCGQMITVMDVFPTLARAAGLKPLNRLPFDGRDRWEAILADRSAPREDIFFGSGSDAKFFYAIFSGEWKLVREIARQDGSATNLLYRIAEDPGEKQDLAARHPVVVRDLAARIDAWRKLYPPDGIMNPKKTAPPGSSAPAQVRGGSSLTFWRGPCNDANSWLPLRRRWLRSRAGNRTSSSFWRTTSASATWRATAAKSSRRRTSTAWRRKGCGSPTPTPERPCARPRAIA